MLTKRFLTRCGLSGHIRSRRSIHRFLCLISNLLCNVGTDLACCRITLQVTRCVPIAVIAQCTPSRTSIKLMLLGTVSGKSSKMHVGVWEKVLNHCYFTVILCMLHCLTDHWSQDIDFFYNKTFCSDNVVLSVRWFTLYRDPEIIFRTITCFSTIFELH